jgi:signal transduction histidine kinase
VLASLEELEASLAERRKAADLAEAADRNKDRFIAILVHELRNPLAPIQNAAELLRRDPLDGATSRQTSEIIVRQVRGMTRLVDAHGGTIRAVSAGPGRGTEFIVRVPCYPATPPPVS